MRTRTVVLLLCAASGAHAALEIGAEDWLKRGIGHQNARQYDEAAADYKKALQLNPRLADAWESLGEIDLFKGKYVAAIEEFTKAIELRPPDKDSTDVLVSRGQAYERNRQYKEALADYSAAIKLDDFMGPHVERARLYEKMGWYDEAIADFTQILHDTPNCVRCLNDRGLAYLQKGAYDEALADFDKALRLKPDSPETKANRERALKTKAEAKAHR